MIAPTALNVTADVVLLLYPLPIIFMANIPRSLRYSLFFLFGLYGIVTASAIVRVTLMTAGRLLEENNVYASGLLQTAPQNLPLEKDADFWRVD